MDNNFIIREINPNRNRLLTNETMNETVQLLNLGFRPKSRLKYVNSTKNIKEINLINNYYSNK